MAEELQAAAPEGVDPLATSLALAGASRATADAFLQDQRHHMHEQLKEIGLRLWELRLGVLLRIATAFTGLVVAAGLAFLIWSAAESNDLVIDSFQVPPDLAARGLSGPVVAAKLADKIAAMQAETVSVRAPRSYANGLNDGLKLEIPETGVSLFELHRFLRAQLGHDLHIGGEMVQGDDAISLTARVGGDSATVTGGKAEIDALLQKLAEQVYGSTQPYRYAVWLKIKGRSKEGNTIIQHLAATGAASERAWAFNAWGNTVSQNESDRAGLALLYRGRTLDPDNYLLVANIARVEASLGRDEDSLRDDRLAGALAAAHGRNYTLAEQIAILDRAYRGLILREEGDLQESTRDMRAVYDQAVEKNLSSGISRSATVAEVQARLHEPSAARAVLAEVLQTGSDPSYLPMVLPTLAISMEEHDWPAALAAEKDFTAIATQWHGVAEDKTSLLDPQIAVALAHMGRFGEADARLKPMPADCYPCLRARAQVAALEGAFAGADLWFSRAAAAGPSIPFAESEWGQSLLGRGRPDAAIEKFKLANQKGPHFADPLEGWGEALMAKNQSHLALAKFEQADKYAPHWGRLHMKWGEALVYAGHADEAKAQFARAAALDLTPSEKAELAHSHAVAANS